MDEKEIMAIIRDIQASPTECEWVEIKHNNEDPESIGEYVSALANGAAYMGQSRGYMAWGLDDNTHQIIGTKFNPKTAKYGNEELENWIAHNLTPRIDFSFQEITLQEGRVVIMMVDSAGNTPVKFKGLAYIRVGTYKKKLADFPERERKIWQNTQHSSFETKIAMSAVSDDEVLELLDYAKIFSLLHLPFPDSKTAIIDKLVEEQLIVRRQSCFDITNLGAILFANDLKRFELLARKAVRVIFYKENDRINAIREQVNWKGYAVGFEGLVDYISANLPVNEEIGKALRKEIPIIASRIISDTIAAKYIKLDDATASSKKYARYVPFWV